jgi:hypothetical protein
VALNRQSNLPTRFLGLVTRTALAEMLAHTYADAKNIDPNESYSRLDTALHNLKLIEGVQQAIWHALIAKKEKLDDKELIEHLAKKLEKPRRYKAWRPKRNEQGPAAALAVLIDMGASVSSGEAVDLLYRPEGEKLLAEGFRLVGEHLASELLR